MASELNKQIDLARANLAYAKAELMLEVHSAQNIQRALRHIREADARLKPMSPEFDRGDPRRTPRQNA